MGRDKQERLRVRILRLTALAVICFALSLNALYAAWWESGIIPVPPQSKKVSEQKKTILGRNAETTYYTSVTPRDEIKDFYIRQLGELGWEQSKIFAGLPLGKDAEKAQQAQDFLANYLFFEKKDQKLMVFLTPEYIYSDAKTHFSISKWQQGAGEQEGQVVPELNQKPKKEVTPVYPGAYLANLAEDENSLRAMYVSEEADAEKIAAFYKKGMQGYGWLLTEEEPLHKISMQELTGAPKKDCPFCKKAKEKVSAPELKTNLEILAMRMVFSNSSGDICQIVLSRNAESEAAAGAGITIIKVNYAKKTE